MQKNFEGGAFLTFFLFSFLFIASLSSCSSDSDSSDDGGRAESLTDKINSGEADFTGQTLSEDVTVTSDATIKGGNFAGHTLTLNCESITLDGVTNVKIETDKPSVTIHLKNTTLNTLSVPSGTKIIIDDEGEDTTKVEKLEVSDGGRVNVVTGGEGDSSTALSQIFTGAGDVDSVTPVTVTKVEIEGDCAITTYGVGELFNYTGLSAKVIYSDGNNSTFDLTKNNSTLTNFDTASAGNNKTATIVCTFAGKSSAAKTISYSVTAQKSLIQQGIDLLNSEKYDEGLTKFRAAYTAEKTDETKLYYALTLIASLSANADLKSLIKDNFGIQNYPGTLNALLTEGGRNSWMSDVVGTSQESVRVYTPVQNDSGRYIKVSGTLLTYEQYQALTFEEQADCVYGGFNGIPFYDVKDVGVIDGWDYEDLCGKYYSYIKHPVASANGKCFIQSGSYPTRDGETVANSCKFDIGNYWDADTFEKTIITETKNYPVLKDIAWLHDGEHGDKYTGTLIDGAKTASSFSLLLAANLIDGNSQGANDLIDKLAKVFGSDVNTAATVVDSMASAEVTVPGDLLHALRLDGLLGDDTIKVSKTEAQCLMGAFKVLQGVFEFLQSYDFTCNLSSIKDTLKNNGVTADTVLRDIQKVTGTQFLATRNAAKAASAKATVQSGLEVVSASLDAMMNKTTSSYPQAVIDILSDKCTAFNSMIKKAVACLKANDEAALFPIAKSFDLGSEYNPAAADIALTINTKKLFEAGALKDIFDRDDSGKFKVYYSYEWDYYNSTGYQRCYGESENYDEAGKTDTTYSAILEKIKGEITTAGGTFDDYDLGGYRSYYPEGRIFYYVKIPFGTNTSASAILSGDGLDSDIYVKVYDTYFYADDLLD